MTQTWSSWKRFPNARSGDSVEAPIGPGVYEVRHTMTGELIAFGHSANVAGSLAAIKVDSGANGWMKLFRREVPNPRVDELEYRTYAAGSRAEAKTAANRFIGLRQNYWGRRMGAGAMMRA